MHISDLFGQYQRNFTSNSTDELKGASSMQKLVSTVSELAPGSVFEGTVSSVRGGKVTLSLSTGQSIVAQLTGKVPLSVGQPMFFQVKSNEGGVLAIRPYNREGTGSNPILLNALTSAGVPVTERNLAMVNAMMRQQLPINKQSVLEMVKFVSANEDVSVQTVVDMVRLGIPVDAKMAAQYERFEKGDAVLLGKMEQAINQVTELLYDESILPDKAADLNHKLVDVILNPNTSSGVAMDDVEQLLLGNQAGRQAAATVEFHTSGNFTGAAGGIDVSGTKGVLLSENQVLEGNIPLGNQLLQQVFSEAELEQLTKLLQGTPALVDNPELFLTETGEEIFVDTMAEEGAENVQTEVVSEQAPDKQVLNTQLTVERFLKVIQQGIAEKQEYGFLGIQKLFASKEYQGVLKALLQEQWLLTPEKLKEEGKVTESYERMLQQAERLEQIIRSTGLEQQTQTLQITADVRGNVEFMQQINQMYTFVQLPLKLSGQNANGDLYVYTNKKNLKDPDVELSAFLHLDMEHLGPTDISVKLLRKNVKTNFYFADDLTYKLVEQYLPVLEKKLNAKGFTCTFTVTNEEKKVDFVNDFLRKDLPPAGNLHRYSFDVRT